MKTFVSVHKIINMYINKVIRLYFLCGLQSKQYESHRTVSHNVTKLKSTKGTFFIS